MWTKKNKLMTAAIIIVCILLYFVLPLRIISVDYTSISCTECRIVGSYVSMSDEKAGQIVELLKDCRAQGTLNDLDSIPSRPDIYIVFELKNSIGQKIDTVEIILKHTEKEEYYYTRGRILSTFAAKIINGRELYDQIMEIMK